MSTVQGHGPMTAADLATFAEKLEAWARALSSDERTVLGRLLIQAAAVRSPAVQAFMMNELDEPVPAGASGGTRPYPVDGDTPHLLAATEKIHSTWVTGYQSYLGDLGADLVRIIKTVL